MARVANRDSYYYSNGYLNTGGIIKAISSSANGVGVMSFVGGILAWSNTNGSAATAGATATVVEQFKINESGNATFSGDLLAKSRQHARYRHIFY